MPYSGNYTLDQNAGLIATLPQSSPTVWTDGVYTLIATVIIGDSANWELDDGGMTMGWFFAAWDGTGRVSFNPHDGLSQPMNVEAVPPPPPPPPDPSGCGAALLLGDTHYGRQRNRRG